MQNTNRTEYTVAFLVNTLFTLERAVTDDERVPCVNHSTVIKKLCKFYIVS